MSLFSFRMQWKIIRSILYDKRDNCVVMATGLTSKYAWSFSKKTQYLRHILRNHFYLIFECLVTVAYGQPSLIYEFSRKIQLKRSCYSQVLSFSCFKLVTFSSHSFFSQDISRQRPINLVFSSYYGNSFSRLLLICCRMGDIWASLQFTSIKTRLKNREKG